MTTKVTVDAHAGWPVEVVIVDDYSDREITENTETVAPNTARDFYATQNRSFRIREMPRDHND